MRTYERSGVTVDQCGDCRGIFLDRGELERLVDAEQGWQRSHPAPATATATGTGLRPRPRPGLTASDDDDDHRRYSQGSHKKRKKSFFDELV